VACTSVQVFKKDFLTKGGSGPPFKVLETLINIHMVNRFSCRYAVYSFVVNAFDFFFLHFHHPDIQAALVTPITYILPIEMIRSL
jgi:hypothetical protein